MYACICIYIYMSGKNDHKAIAKEAQKAKQKLDKKR
jgi:hypothetical protein